MYWSIIKSLPMLNGTWHLYLSRYALFLNQYLAWKYPIIDLIHFNFGTNKTVDITIPKKYLSCWRNFHNAGFLLILSNGGFEKQVPQHYHQILLKDGISIRALCVHTKSYSSHMTNKIWNLFSLFFLFLLFEQLP